MTKTTNKVSDTDLNDRYSRQTLTYGKGAMTKICQARVLISCKTGFSGAALELAKCVIMAGVDTVDLHSRCFRLDYPDLSSNYYCDESDVELSSTLAETDESSDFDPDSVFEKIRQNLASLNPSVTVRIIRPDLMLDTSTIDRYGTVVFADYLVEELGAYNRICREQSVQSMGIWTFGMMGSIFCDFLDHEVTDLTGAPIKTGVIQSIKDHIFTTSEPHKLSTGSAIRFNDRVLSLTPNKTYLVYVLNTHQFQICAHNSKVPSDPDQRMVWVMRAPKFNVIDQTVKNITFEEQRLPITRNHRSYSDIMGSVSDIDQSLVRFDMMRWFRPLHLMAFHRAVSIGGDMDYNGLRTLFRFELKICSNSDMDDETSRLFDLLYHTYTGRVTGIDSVVGAIGAQEVIKAISHKYEPINQIMYFDALDILPDSYLRTREESPDQFEDLSDRLDGQRRIFGSLPITDQRVFVVGSGAVGCEHIKNLAMMGVGSGENGQVTVTDMDNIELSNLNRQFLFRSKDIGNSKSETAVAAARQMNPKMQIEAHNRKVCRETENVYDQKFMKDTTIVMNALDNVQARKYMDSRCVESHTPLLECGTLGTIGSVQVVMPRVTESYGSFDHAEQTDSIPVCTLKLFPSTFEHVVEYARSAFESHFVVPQSTYLKIMKDANSLDQMGPTDLVSAHRQIMGLIENCKNFKYCIRLAFNIFHQIFRDPVSQLIRKYPEDHTTDEGELFWSGSKIFPTVIEFDFNNSAHLDFVIYFSHIWADTLNIPQSKRYGAGQRNRFKKFVQTLEVPEEVKNEDVDLNEDDEDGDEKKAEPEIDSALLRDQILMMVEKSRNILKGLTPAEFEKDDDSNHHVDFMASVTHLRCQNYHIQTKDRLHVKGVAGKIIPAIATTTSIVSGLMSLEFYKVVYAFSLGAEEAKAYATPDRFRYGTFNLGNSIFAFGESVPPKVTRVGKKEYTIWSTDQFEPDLPLEEVIEHYDELAAGGEDSNSESDSDDESNSDEESESLIENPLVVHSVYLGDELVYNEFMRDGEKTLGEIIREYDENLDEASRDHTFQITMAPETVTDDLDEVQDSSVNIRFTVHL
jgi:ubiquitin-activating enzyme E1